MRHIVSVALILVGILHILPLAGVLGPDRLASMFGVTVDEPNMTILMRHRAVLFGILGVFMVLAGFIPGMQPAALGAGLISVASFLLLAWSTGGYNANVGRVVTADVVALIVLLLGLGAWVAARRGQPRFFRN